MTKKEIIEELERIEDRIGCIPEYEGKNKKLIDKENSLTDILLDIGRIIDRIREDT